ncbi:MAG TPA: hypothetical protein ENH35_04015 [Candidatus Moranbacteria bacterium]|nr:hypothetical protein [Candidatus Moranbacteria bacterium]
MECKREENKKSCPCTHDCSRRGICCECIRHHQERDELPGCYFSAETEKTYDRSVDKFISDRN